MRRLLSTIAVSLTMLVACASSRTELLLEVSADPEIRARASAVQIRVRGEGRGEATDVTERRPITENAWPMRATLIPRGGDATRTVVIELDAIAEDGGAIARVVAQPTFEPGRTRTIALHLEAECLGVRCGTGETCAAGRCEPTPIAPVDPPDAGTARGDGGPDECVMQASWLDRDGDGYGDPASMSISCAARVGPSRGGDCDDACPSCQPGGTEVCDGERDEDCDANVDEDCECTIGELRPCPGGSDTGPCHAGTQACVGGRWSECIGRYDPSDEVCNAIDDDCDGEIDDGVHRSCGRGCESACRLGSWTACVERRGGEDCEDD